ncbi:hypothetical protein evm_011756 [Chilo suppressalis]|nr:hypothetical protein evm_011756 [Chilo suppressalis]
MLRAQTAERRRTRRRLRNQLNIPIIPDLEFIKNYRLSPELFEEICRELVPLLPRKAKRHAIDPTIKILTALNFYARESYQGSVGQNLDGPMAQQTVSRCLQEICDSECYITNVDASYGGATHDSYIWRESVIKTQMESLQNEAVYLLEDSGYALREHMMTPIDNAVETSPEG